MKELLELKEAASLVKYSPAYLAQLAREEVVPAIKRGRKWFFDPDALVEALFTVNTSG